MPPVFQRHRKGKPLGVFVLGIVTLLFKNLKQPEFGSDMSLLLHNAGVDDSVSPQKDEISFQDLELLQLVGSGDVSMGFKAKIRGRDGVYIAKITGDALMRWSDTEIQMFHILNSPPTIPNIPQLEFAVKSMPNQYHNRTHLEKDLGLDPNNAKQLMQFKNVSILVMEFLGGNHHFPKNMQETRVFMRSLLQSLQFAHSRNVMLCDLHTGNVFFDGEMVTLFDWNGGFFFQPEVVKMHYNGAPIHLMPPEGRNNKNAVHSTVSSFDIWSAGLMLKKMVNRKDSSISDSFDDSTDELTESRLNDFLNAMLTKDPYKRPDAGKLLQHPFLQSSLIEE